MATTSTASHYISLAKTLPPKLQRFFARYPPARILEPLPTGALPRTGYQADRANPFLPKKHSATGKTHDPVFSLRRQADLVKVAREHGVEELLPYTPKKTEEQLKHRVKYGLRVKGTGVDQKVKGKIHERQKAVKYVLFRSGLLSPPLLPGKGGFAAGRTQWTDFCDNRMEKRREAMLKMPALIREWKAVSFERPVLLWSQSCADNHGRLDGRTGPGGPNKRQHGQYESLRDVQICIQKYNHTERNISRREHRRLPPQDRATKLSFNAQVTLELFNEIGGGVLPPSCISTPYHGTALILPSEPHRPSPFRPHSRLHLPFSPNSSNCNPSILCYPKPVARDSKPFKSSGPKIGHSHTQTSTLRLLSQPHISPPPRHHHP